MVSRQNIPSDFKNWLDAVQAVLQTQIIVDLSKERLVKLSADMLERVSAKTAAEELIGKLPDLLVEELADKPMEDLVYELAQRLNNNLLDSMAETATNWLEEKLVKNAQEGLISLHPTRSPIEMAQWLTRQMADESKIYFCKPGEGTTVQPDEVSHSIFRIAGLAATMIFTRTHKSK